MGSEQHPHRAASVGDDGSRGAFGRRSTPASAVGTGDAASVVLEYWRLRSEQRIAESHELLDPGLMWRVVGLSTIMGRTRFAAMERTFLEHLDGGVVFTVDLVVAQGDSVAITLRSEARLRDGRPYGCEYGMFFRVRAGRIASVCGFVDTKYLVETLAMAPGSDADLDEDRPFAALDEETAAPLEVSDGAAGVVLEYWRRRSRHRGVEARELLDPEVTWDVPGFGGAANRAEFARMEAAFLEHLDGGMRFAVDLVVAQGHNVAIMLRSKARLKDGRPYGSEYGIFFVVREQRIASVRQFADTRYLAEKLRSQPAQPDPRGTAG